MQLHLALLLPLLSGVLALPATNTTSTFNLEKREHHGWIGSFSSSDCSGKWIGKRPEVHLSDCVKFSRDAAAQNIGVFGGEGIYHIRFLSVFSDENCKNAIPNVDGTPNGFTMPGKRSCTSAFANVKSVQWAQS